MNISMNNKDNYMKFSCRDVLLNKKISKSLIDKIKTLNNEDVERITTLLSLLDNPIRFRIVYYLSQLPLPVCVLTYLLKAEQTVVSHHLAILRKHNIIDARVAGKYRVYYLKDERIKHLLFCIFRDK